MTRLDCICKFGLGIGHDNNLFVNIENHESPPAKVFKNHSTTKDISNFCHDILFMTIGTIYLAKSGQKSPEIIFNKSNLKSTSKFNAAPKINKSALNFLLCLTDCQMHHLMDLLMDRLLDRLMDHLMDHLTDHLTDCLMDHLMDRLTDCLTDHLTV